MFGLFEDKKKMKLESEILKDKEAQVDALLQDMLYEILHVKGEFINEQDTKEMGKVVLELTNLMMAVSTKVKNEFIKEVLCFNSGEVTFERVRDSMINFAVYKLSISDRVDPTYYAGPFDETQPFNQRKYNEHIAKMNNEKIKPVEEYIFNNDKFDNNFLNAYNSVSRDTNAYLELMGEVSKNYLKSKYPVLDTITGKVNSYSKLMGSCFIIGYNIKEAEIIFNFNVIFDLNHDSTILEILQSSLSPQDKIVEIALYKERNNTLINFGEEFRKYTYFKLEELQDYLTIILQDFLSQNLDSFEELHIDKDAVVEFVYRNAILGYSFKIAEQLLEDYNFFKYTEIS